MPQAGKCADCHTMRNIRNGTAMLEAGTGAGWNRCPLLAGGSGSSVGIDGIEDPNREHTADASSHADYFSSSGITEAEVNAEVPSP